MCPLLQVFDMPTSIAFYRDLLGFEIISPVPDDLRTEWVLLSLYESELMLNTAYEVNERPSQPDPSRLDVHRDTSLFFDCADVDEAYAHLRAKGLSIAEPVLRDYGMKQLYFFDPDGYEICFQQPVTDDE
jgi:catechol 2,3-dioxygenase-like lactoylglutathione lyase family enzyme